MEQESVADVLSRKLPHVPKRTRAQIVERLSLAGVVDGRYVKRLKRHHVKEHMGDFLLAYVTQEGMFLSEEDKSHIQNAITLMDHITGTKRDFKEAILLFENVHWPSLNEIPRRFVTASEGKLWLYGRRAFPSLHDMFMQAECGCMELDGTMGVGKSYLLVMLALQCFCDFKGTDRRLVCLFTVPDEPVLLLSELKMALLLAFAGSKMVQRDVLAAESIAELAAVVEDLKLRYKLYFIFDGWNVLDAPRSPACQNVYDVLTQLEKGCRSLHACSDADRGKPRVGVAYESHCNPLSEEELNIYLEKEGVCKHTLLEEYTGLLPLYVRVLVTCQRSANSDEELVVAYENSDQLNALHTSFTQTISGLSGISDSRKLDLYAQLLSGTAPKESLPLLDDQRWVRVSDGNITLFSHYARQVLVNKLEFMLEAEDLDRVIDQVALQVVNECRNQTPNKFLLGWFMERLVVHIAKRWLIGEDSLDDKSVKRVISFDRMPHCATSIVTACFPLSSTFAYCDFVARFEIPCLSDPSTPVLRVHAYEVSLSLESGDRHWKKPDNFFDPLFARKLIGEFPHHEVKWAYTFIGRSCHRRPNGSKRTAGTEYYQQFLSFSDLSTSFGGSISDAVKAALQAADSLV